MPKKQPGILRRITAQLTRQSTALEPIMVMLECGHTTKSSPTTTRARCDQCKRATRMNQVAGRKRASLVRRALEHDASTVFVRVSEREKGRARDVPLGPRVYRVEVMDVTPTAHSRKPQPQHVACESLVIACDAAGLEYVRAKLLEMGEALDGVVLVT